MTTIFKVESDDIARLNDMHLTQLLQGLLRAEAQSFGIAQRAIEVALNITTGDGGEDGRISWNGEPSSTDFIPNRLSLFQNKATSMGPSAYGAEILTEQREVKPNVDQVLRQGGSYIVFTTQELNKKQKTDRLDKIRLTLRCAGKSYAESCDIQIFDAAQIAIWANKHVSAVVAVQHWAGKPMVRGLKNFSLWSEHEDLKRLPFARVPSRDGLITSLRENLAEPKACFRVMGLSGLGKTRLAFQVFVEDEIMRSIVVYVDANHTSHIDGLIADWVSLGYRAIIVVDNCEYTLHERLVKEVRRESSNISLLSLDYNFDNVSSPTISLKLEQMTNEELLGLLRPVYGNQLSDLPRIVEFAQGFPQMAVLLADARLNEDPKLGMLTEDELAEKLLWKRGEIENTEHLRILQVCSLFDVFGVEEEFEQQLVHIASLLGADVDRVYACIQKYSERGLIDRRGRLGQVVPKPLAIRLAGQWWTNSRDSKRLELVDGLPDGMVEGFCKQIEKMDFHSDVKQLTEKLCGPLGPFGQAEVILTNRGSRLFRSFINVNPEVTAATLFRILSELNHQELLAIKGETRRNLVWGLERLCFHADLFKQSAWNLLLLASAENERWSNNATGIFAQFFRVHLSGTAAEPKLRLSLINDAMRRHSSEVDKVLLDALAQAVTLQGATRTVGAEYQGSKPPLEEWRPRIWNEAFDYWDASVGLLVEMASRGREQKERAIEIIGNSIRGFVALGRLDMIERAINAVVELNGRYWPSALGSIKATLKYDQDKLYAPALKALNTWLTMLSPDEADLSEKLKIVVSNPPWEHRKGADGRYVDVAADKARLLAIQVATDTNALVPYIGDLLVGQQKQGISFGEQLSVEAEEFDYLITLSLSELAVTDSPNLAFVIGLLRGAYQRAPKSWAKYVDMVAADNRLISYYPYLLCTGQINQGHLNSLVALSEQEAVPARSLSILGHGGVMDKVPPDVVSTFCVRLAAIGGGASWAALNIIYMYWFGNPQIFPGIKGAARELVTLIPLNRESQVEVTEMYGWKELVSALIKEEGGNLPLIIAKKIINDCENGFDHSDLSIYIKPLLLELMQKFGELIWPVLGEAIVKAGPLQRYCLKELLDRENSAPDFMPSLLSVLPTDIIIKWAKEHPDVGPDFIASCVNIFDHKEDHQKPSELFVSILENFGAEDSVRVALIGNNETRGWSGSLVPYLRKDRVALETLQNHESDNVKQWVSSQLRRIDIQIEQESRRDDERGFWM